MFQPLQTTTNITSHTTLLSRISRRCTQLLLHPLYTLFISVLSILQLTLLIWGLAHHKFFTDINPEDTAYVVIDIIVVCLLSIETLIRILSTYQTYFKSVINIVFDIGVLLLIVMTLSLYTTQPEDALLATLLQVVRSAVQLARVILVLQHHKQRTKIMMASDSNINFQQFSVINNHETDGTAININSSPFTLPYSERNNFSHILTPSFTIDADNTEHNISHVFEQSPAYTQRSNSIASSQAESATLISMAVEPVDENKTEQHAQFIVS